ncbi:MAG: fumarylacetoacetate hydrolase family protein [Muribaculaceae bacterium]|nr:fumarylacetoacetate hydrolase family protein [Muribaculaceae bacterium]
MKVIGLTNNGKIESVPQVFLMADSTLLKDGKPFFYPDFTSSISYRSAFVIRICRLGKNISRKFAPRYYDAVTVGLTLKADDIEQDLKAKNQPTDLATSFDGAAILGNFINIEELHSGIENMKYSISQNSEIVNSFSYDSLALRFDEIIERISKYYTLKIGDIIYTGYNDFSGIISIDDKLEGSLDGTEILNLKIR